MGIRVGDIYTIDMESPRYFPENALVVVTKIYPCANTDVHDYLLEPIYERKCDFMRGEILGRYGMFIRETHFKSLNMRLLINVFEYSEYQMILFKGYLKYNNIELREEEWR